MIFDVENTDWGWGPVHFRFVLQIEAPTVFSPSGCFAEDVSGIKWNLKARGEGSEFQLLPNVSIALGGSTMGGYGNPCIMETGSSPQRMK